MPSKLAEHYAHGRAAALERFGLRQASEELRLKIPRRSFHGLEAAHKEPARSAKKANEDTADLLEKILEQVPVPPTPGDQTAPLDPLDRPTAWGSATNPSAGEGSNMNLGQPTSFGGV